MCVRCKEIEEVYAEMGMTPIEAQSKLESGELTRGQFTDMLDEARKKVAHRHTEALGVVPIKGTDTEVGQVLFHPVVKEMFLLTRLIVHDEPTGTRIFETIDSDSDASQIFPFSLEDDYAKMGVITLLPEDTFADHREKYKVFMANLSRKSRQELGLPEEPQAAAPAPVQGLIDALRGAGAEVHVFEL